METSLHNVASIPEAARSVLEGLVGHPLRNNDVLYITTLGTQQEPGPVEKSAAWDELESIIGEAQRNAAKSGLSSEQIDGLLDAECKAVRGAPRT